MILRQAELSDAPALQKYKKQIFGESDFLSRSSEEYTNTVEDETKIIVDMTEKENAWIVVAEEDQEIVGLLNIRPEQLQRQKHWAGVGLSVKKAYWSQGIGRKLLEKGIQLFEESSLHRLELMVDCRNERAIALYRKLGFVEEGISKDFIKIDESYYDMMIMAIVKSK